MMEKARIHVLVNYGFIAFFGAVAFIRAIDFNGLATAGFVIMAGSAAVLLVASLFKERVFKMIQTVFLGLIGYVLVLTNHISQYSGLILLIVVLLMSWQYGYLKKRLFIKAFVSMTLLFLASVVSAYNVMQAPRLSSGDVILDIVASVIFIITTMYLLTVLVFLPALRNAKRTESLSRLLDIQTAYYLIDQKDDDTVIETDGGAEKGFFSLGGDGQNHAMIAYEDDGVLGATIHRFPDHFVNLSREEVLRLVAKMKLLERIDHDTLSRIQSEDNNAL